MELNQDAREALEARARQALKASSLDGARRAEAYHELVSHLHDAARALAIEEGAPEVTRLHVQRAIDDEAAAAIAGQSPWITLPATLRGWVPVAAAVGAAVAVGLHAAVGACTQAGCLTPGYSPLLVAASLVGVASALARLRWPLVLAATLTAALLVLGEAFPAGPTVALGLQALAAATAEPRPRRLRKTLVPDGRLRLLVPFLLVGMAAPWMAEFLVEGMGLHTEGASEELAASLSLATLLAGALAVAVRQRSLGFLAAAAGVTAFGVLVGWLALFAWSFGGPDTVPAPDTAGQTP